MDITSIRLEPKYHPMTEALNALSQRSNGFFSGVGYDVTQRVNAYPEDWYRCVGENTLGVLDSKVKSGRPLLFHEAFSGMCFVLAATNNLIRRELFPGMTYERALTQGTAFLQLMAMKEVTSGLTPDEIAGMVAAAYLDVVVRFGSRRVLETSGMGGDYGWNSAKTLKTINISTLSAFVLSSMGFDVQKHGSFGNTTKIGSTDVPLSFGANIAQSSLREMRRVFNRVGLLYTDAHAVKTLHYLSHLLRTETVNHVIGPMTPPIAADTPLFKVMGVNHHVDPLTVAHSYTLLHQRGVVQLGGAAIIAGLRLNSIGGLTKSMVRKNTMLDELSPYGSVIALAAGDRMLGLHYLEDRHFDGKPLHVPSLQIPNQTRELMVANQMTLQGHNKELARYLARNVALGLLLIRGGLRQAEPLSMLRECYADALDAILSGQAFNTLVKYVEATGGTFRSWV